MTLAENCGFFAKQIHGFGFDARLLLDLNWIEEEWCVKSLRLPTRVYLLLVRCACVADSYLIGIWYGCSEYFMEWRNIETFAVFGYVTLKIKLGYTGIRIALFMVQYTFLSW